ncbi:1-alkyl-2-acetylglycerophosphocholine esterase [Streptococcus sanguinis]|uniref:GDSL-like Lipase/Acylhydrolase n=1 Tax=Streptococcus sanguinis TaxID=1305 RepID=A0ABD7JNA8_STRSA|nr:SGNH/GDSL hydrolase family protein [Streptococcus sanguinis]PLA64149.1 1-alkyl-2-acetylglycerophosphocholine esterase [Streptococcus salivarius]RSI26505.1 GDSL-like Lipase/Acylhydrolase [Streptococcus sanguinis]RSI42753.1 GDSL-like Lipase/Acylhydrolase [Streptococcus sanguinis]RSI50107.1 GDSL-like Lipase/Acylhydrolase [Streptococcus sanguinis]
MAVQLLEEWLLKEQAKLQQNYRELNQVSVKEPDIIFIGDSIVEYYPLYELLQTDKRLVNRGIRGYKTDLLLENLDAHLFGQALDKVFILIGTNDIGKEMPQTETLANLEAVLQEISRDYPLAQIQLLSVLPVNEAPVYKSTVYVRSNEKIQALNQAYRQLANAYMNVQFIDLYDAFLNKEGQLSPDYTTDGLHLTIAGYATLSKALQEYL